MKSIRSLSRFSRSIAQTAPRTFHTTLGTHEPKLTQTRWADPAMRQYKFWNREDPGEKGKYSYLIEISPESIQREAKILSLSDPSDAANGALHNGELPLGSRLVGVGTSLGDFEFVRNGDVKPNVLFVSPSCPRAASTLPLVLAAFPSIEWVHCRSAGIDFIESDELVQISSSTGIQVTNAKGQFSSTLAEYALMACSFFAKDVPRLIDQKQQRSWNPYSVLELRGSTLGIVGYGDIGRAVAKLATVYGMRIVALRRHPFLSKNDPYCDVVYGRDKASLNRLMSESDYIVCSAPSTVETRGMIDVDAFQSVKDGAVFINLGRGPIVDEEALMSALTSGRLKGAALDVFTEEPLPPDSKWWDIPNVLVSPHIGDLTQGFQIEACNFFLNENLPRFICGEELLNPVDPGLGY